MRRPIRGSSSALPFLFVALVAATTAIAGESAFARHVATWIGVGPRVVHDGYLGGDPAKYCNHCDSTGSVQCPDYSKTGCGGTYSGCYCSSDTDCGTGSSCPGHTCTNTFNCNECGTGGEGGCRNACTSSCN